MKRTAKNNKFMIGWIGLFVVSVLIFAIVIYKVADGVENYNLPTGSIEVNSEYSSYIVGETINVSVNNNLNTTIFINNECPGEPLNVYHFDGSQWVAKHENTNKDSCPYKERQIAIKPNQSETVSYQEWKGLFDKPGKYRILAAVSGFQNYPYQDIEITTEVLPTSTPAPTPPIRAIITPKKTPTATTKPNPTSTTTAPREENEVED